MKDRIGRNAPCPCGSGKKYKQCCRNKSNTEERLRSYSWIDSDGCHIIAPGAPPSPEELDKMSEEYQKRIRKSPIWKEMVKKFGKEKAEELLKEFRVKQG